MISLAGRDILHAWGKFVFTGIGLGLLIGVTLVMAGVYRGMIDDAMVLLDNSGADLWVVQKDTQGPYAESSSLYDDTWRGIAAMPGVTSTRRRQSGAGTLKNLVRGRAPAGSVIGQVPAAIGSHSMRMRFLGYRTLLH
jgi:putative ABC transport system permease protein